MTGRTTPSVSWLAPLEAALEAGQILRVLEATPALLRRMARTKPPSWFRFRRKKGDWSRLDVLCHMIDTETVTAFRLRKMLAEDSPNISFFDQEKWVERLRDFRDRDPGRAVSGFFALRAGNAAILSALPPDRMKRTGIHPEIGRLTVLELAARLARHDVNHLRQIVDG